ncbi:MAG TPA: hypothetical protein VFX49_19655 [Chloroflexota bacterium]|nr:hypothetical protein [Chloroflexota bacterium]
MPARSLAVVVTCYLALSLALGVAQQTLLWAHGQHATAQQASLHERLEQRGLANHHHPARPGGVPRSPLEPLLPAAQSYVSAAPSLAPAAPLDGTSCAAAPVLLTQPLCGVGSLPRPPAVISPAPSLEPPRQPPRAR